MDENDKTSIGEEEESFEGYPLTRPEYLNVMVHFYRGESHRAMLWRQRLDTTTNWAVLTSAGVLSFAFAESTHEPVIVLLSNLIILVYLLIEAQRYRYFLVYRARVRMLEENFLLPVISRQLHSPRAAWRKMVAMDLDKPKFKNTLLEAVGFRLRRNYLYIFFLLLGGWWLKLMMHPDYASSLREVYERMAVGWIPSWVILAGQGIFYTGLVGIVWYAHRKHAGVPQDEIGGLESDLDHWKV